VKQVCHPAAAAPRDHQGELVPGRQTLHLWPGSAGPPRPVLVAGCRTRPTAAGRSSSESLRTASPAGRRCRPARCLRLRYSEVCKDRLVARSRQILLPPRPLSTTRPALLGQRQDPHLNEDRSEPNHDPPATAMRSVNRPVHQVAPDQWSGAIRHVYPRYRTSPGFGGTVSRIRGSPPGGDFPEIRTCWSAICAQQHQRTPSQTSTEIFTGQWVQEAPRSSCGDTPRSPHRPKARDHGGGIVFVHAPGESRWSRVHPGRPQECRGLLRPRQADRVGLSTSKDCDKVSSRRLEVAVGVGALVGGEHLWHRHALAWVDVGHEVGP
jgi:hypothetical protein